MSPPFSKKQTVTVRELALYPEKCTACMSCILACSLHHRKRFDKKGASITVSICGKERKISLLIQKGKEGELQSCDYCDGEKEPLCVKYCVPKAIDLGNA